MQLFKMQKSVDQITSIVFCTLDQHKSSEAQTEEHESWKKKELLNTCKNQDTSISQSYTYTLPQIYISFLIN